MLSWLLPYTHRGAIAQFRGSLKLDGMTLRNRTRLNKLCSQALAEPDPQKMADLLSEIDNILSETLDELTMMLNDVEQVLKKKAQSSRIHLA